MNDGQNNVFSTNGDSYTAVLPSPCIEVLRKKGIEVMYARWTPMTVKEFDGKNLKA